MTLGVMAPAYDRIDPRHHGVVSERALFHGYALVARRRLTTSAPCACGTPVVAISLGDVDVAAAVATHNELPGHLAWRTREGVG